MMTNKKSGATDGSSGCDRKIRYTDESSNKDPLQILYAVISSLLLSQFSLSQALPNLATITAL